MHKTLVKEEDKRKSEILMKITGTFKKKYIPETVDEMMTLYLEIRKNLFEYKRIRA